MKKEFFKGFLSAILIAIFSFGTLAQSGSNGQSQKKEKLQVVVVEKKGSDRPTGNGDSQRPRLEERKKSQ
jgi:hypothetical protein